ncbi:hypothetical protein (DUF285 repeat domain) [Campylobacter subantarcticus LMG 24377]|nr:BspA family leucine-rich repeat surface protein [Campylobacter subantarcticus]AJC92635.1 hypothetical protein (DUF285 repeat domain) [Campylobacter subantarcticus LMG 24377]
MQDLDSQLLKAINDLRKSNISEWEAKKAVILELFDKGASIPQYTLDNLETYLSDLEQEYWDDRAVYAGRSIKNSDEYELFNILSRLNAAKSKKKSLDGLFKIAKSKGVTHTPKNKAELVKLVKDKNIYLGDIDISNITNFKNLFKKSKRRDFSGIEIWDVSKVTNMDSCFEDAKYFNHNIQSWNVSKVKSMERMFDGCEIFNQPLDKWDISSVTNFKYMFSCTESFVQNLESWGEKIDFKNSSKSKKISFINMFYSSKLNQKKKYPTWFCSIKNGMYLPKHKDFIKALISNKISLAKIDISEITDMSFLFDDIYGINFDGIETWDVSNVTKMSSMFAGCKNFNGDISKWDVSNVTNMWSMFKGCENFNGDLSKWDVSNVTDMGRMFEGCKNFNGDLSKWDVSNVTKMSSMFAGCKNFNGDLSKWDVSNVTDMSSMFEGCENFNGDLSKWNISNVTKYI